MTHSVRLVKALGKPYMPFGKPEKRMDEKFLSLFPAVRRIENRRLDFSLLDPPAVRL